MFTLTLLAAAAADASPPQFKAIMRAGPEKEEPTSPLAAVTGAVGSASSAVVGGVTAAGGAVVDGAKSAADGTVAVAKSVADGSAPKALADGTVAAAKGSVKLVGEAGAAVLGGIEKTFETMGVTAGFQVRVPCVRRGLGRESPM